MKFINSPLQGGITWRETMRIYIVAKVATQDELVKHITAGVAVENYKAPDQQELDLGE